MRDCGITSFIYVIGRFILLNLHFRILTEADMMWRRIRNWPGGLITLLLSSLSSASVITTAGKDKLGAVSSESKICSEVGIGLLERGVTPAFEFYFEV